MIGIRGRLGQVLIAFFDKNLLLAGRLGIYLTMCFGFLLFLVEPSSQAVMNIQGFIWIAGMLVAGVIPIISHAFAMLFYHKHLSVTAVIEIMLARFTALLAVVWWIGRYGDAAYNWSLANVQDAALYGFAVVILWAITAVGSRGKTASQLSPFAYKPYSGYDTASTAQLNTAQKLSDRDNLYTAAHEAGHVLVYAALRPLPSGVTTGIKDYRGSHGELGYVTGVNIADQLTDKVFATWTMLVFLAGKMGEWKRFGETTLGSRSDHARWLSLAQQYLQNHNDGIFYDDPKNEFEQKHNDAKLEALATEQKVLLDQLFDTNMAVFHDVIACLLDKRSLGTDELAPLLDKVTLPPGFPMPSITQGTQS